MTTVTLDTATRTLANLVEDVKLGAHVLITENENPVAELVPVGQSVRKPQFGSAKGLIEISADFDAPLEDFAEYVK